MAHIQDSFTPSLAPTDELLSRYEEARIWLENHNIRVNVSIFNEYKKIIQKSIAKEEIDATDPNMPDFQWACVELHDLVDIHENLKNHDHPQFLESLKRLIKGPILLQEETSKTASIHGRNFTFELYTASRLARMGFNVFFDGKSDIRFETETASVHVECKRAHSIDNLENLIESGFKQINERCQGDSAKFQCGIVSLSLSRYVYQALTEQGPLFCDPPILQETMRNLLGEWGKYFVPKFSKHLPNGIGILVHYKFPFFSTETSYPTMLNRFLMYEFAKNGDKGFSVINDFRNHASTGPI